MKKNLTVGLVIFGFVALLVLIFIFSGEKPKLKSEIQTARYQKQEDKTPSSGPQATNSFSSLFEQTFLEPNRQNFKEIGIKFEEFKPALREFLESQTTIKSQLSEKQIFNALYPDYFINGLIKTQNFFIEQGFLDLNYQKIENFDSEEKIFSFVNTIIDVFEAQGFYSREKAQEFRRETNTTWKTLLDQEREMFARQKLLKLDFIRQHTALKIYYLKFSINRKILKIFEKFKEIAISKGYAQAIQIDADTSATFYSSKSGDCFKTGPVLPGGANVWAPCCDCGFIIISKKWIFKEVCGVTKNLVPSGQSNLEPTGQIVDGAEVYKEVPIYKEEEVGICDIPLGCLNLYAKGGRPAIWDPESGICGVG